MYSPYKRTQGRTVKVAVSVSQGVPGCSVQGNPGIGVGAKTWTYQRFLGTLHKGNPRGVAEDEANMS